MTPDNRATGQDIADAIIEHGHICNIIDGKTVVEPNERTKAKLEGLADARMVVIPPGTALRITEIVYGMIGERWPDDDVLVRAREVGARLAAAYHENTRHAPFSPLWISANDDTPDSALVGLYFTAGYVRSVEFAEHRLTRTPGGEMRAACITTTNAMLPPAVAAETPEYKPLISLALPALVIAEHIRLRPGDLERVPPNFRTRAASKQVGKISGVRRNPPPVYTLPIDVDGDDMLNLVLDLIWKEEETMLPRVAVIGGDDRIFRQDWSSGALDIRPYLANDAKRVAEASRAGKLDTIVVLTRFVGHAQYDLLKPLSTPVIPWRRGLSELAKVLTNVMAVGEIDAAIRQSDGQDSPPVGAANVQANEPPPKAAPPQIDHALLTWGAGLREILATEDRPWAAEEVADVLDATDYRTDIDAALVAMTLNGEVIMERHDDGVDRFYLDKAVEPAAPVAEPLPVEAPVITPPTAPPAPKETPMLLAPTLPPPTVRVLGGAAAPAPAETVLVSWTTVQSKHEFSEMSRPQAITLVERLLANPQIRDVKLWREAKLRVRVEIE
jgi:hypothetical protein